MLFVDEKHRNKGIATDALLLFEHEMRRQGKEAVSLYVFSHNKAARRLYEKNGYVIDTSISKGKVFSCLVMKKELS